MSGQWAIAVCEVCRLLDHDFRQKLCQWCPTCEAWICKKDIRNLWRRARAMAARARGG
jgi:hypothetical protein